LAHEEAEPEFAGTAGLNDVLEQGRRLLATSPRAAAAQAREILRITPNEGAALRLLAAALRRTGDNAEAERVDVEAIAASSHNPTLNGAAQALTEGRLHDAENLLRPYLEKSPDDAAATRLLAEIAARVGALPDAERLLRRALEIAPAYASARLRLSKLLFQQNRVDDSFEVLEDMLARDPDNDVARAAKAASLGRTGEYSQAISLYEQMLALEADKPGIWLSYGHLLHTVGRLADSIDAYRRAISLNPGFGEAWWSLANLKTARFDDLDIAAMQTALTNEHLSPKTLLQLHFALGKAFEDAGRYEQSFEHYARGNAIRHGMLGYDPEATHDYVQRNAAVFSAGLFESQKGSGNPSPAPIFIVSLPRAGSTLIEQILASHSQIEGTSELHYLPNIVHRLSSEFPDASYPEAVERLDPEALGRLGDEYLRSAAANRKSDKPFFIDKLPNNWLNVGLIQLILPNARIIDARRHPLGCCFSNFKQHFASGQVFSYSLEDLGRYYSDYVRLMDHFDGVLPGKVHRVFHEDMVEDSEREIRRLLDYLELPFEDSCLRFYDNDRAVRTPSGEQVRRPINRDGVEQWKAFEPWLGPLKQALGPVLDCYPEVPAPIA
jgi:tetratricopeptide (TPR) repeat protein